MATKVYNKTILQTSFTSLESIYYLLNTVKDNQPMSHSDGTDTIFPQARARISQARGGEWDEEKRDTHAELTLKEMNFIRYINDDTLFEVSDIGNEFLKSFTLVESPVDDGKVTLSLISKLPVDQKNMLLLEILTRIAVKQENYGRNIHPYLILFKLLSSKELEGYISKQEWACFINDSGYLLDSQYPQILERIVRFRKNHEDCEIKKCDRILTRLVLWEVLDKLESPEGDTHTYFSINETFYRALSIYMLNGESYGNPQRNLNKSKNDDMNEPNIIYYGAPGTGKSHQLKEDIAGAKYIRTIFHPDTDYSSFVGCYKPIDNGQRITYNYQPQAFVKAYVMAWLSQDPIYLVIEEINRGNCAQIFGDIFQLLDRKAGESEYEIEPDTDLQNYLKTEFAMPEHENEIANMVIPAKVLSGEIMKLPANLLIRATMNTSDQSLFPMDSAFKRRWSWRFFSIKDEGKKYVIKLSDDTEYDWWKTIEAINVKILNTTKSADKQIGYWFAKLPEGETTISADDFVSKVIFYLWNDVFKDYSFGDNNAFSSDLTFEKFYSSDGKVIEKAVKDFMNRNYPKEDAETTA